MIGIVSPNWMNQCPTNQKLVNVLAQRASKAPAGNRIKKPTEQSTACAIISFSNPVHGRLEPLDGIGTGVVVELSPEPLPLPLPPPDPVSMTLVRSRVSTPCSSCSTMRASVADEPGFVLLMAYMRLCLVSVFAYITVSR